VTLVPETFVFTVARALAAGPLVTLPSPANADP
jgi:hypothetical protein